MELVFPASRFVNLVNGFLSLYLHSKQNIFGATLHFIIKFNFCSGLQALAFWTIRLDFDMSWWIPNLYLLVYPCFFLKVFGECGSYEINTRKEFM